MSTLLFMIAFCAGAAISCQAAINGQLAGAIGHNTIAAALFSFLSGSVLLAVIAIGRGGLLPSLAALPAQPWWRLTGGLLGAGAIFCTVMLAPRIGLGALLALVIAGQLLSSLAIDHFGLLGVAVRQVSWLKMTGAAVMLGGVLLTLFSDRLTAA
ncbi:MULTISPECIES: DMT family transporter [unclassified Janthinobacterium]|uniref:DMT family transporter n=1 Tax=unclassified Janthinobacterium TaxID=2610881 RepID=UPI001620C7AC|nr:MULTISPECIES: DMT family transporter [unclassified Janthinobacterium]MBB5369135.1 transporter family-2 protein [Janthinobacterium sp. K2C7]MBB5381328.1 transporter family-2 protein [Janthinobacterium sp. K2Li3]MBB5387518.1 transporter family-2 protein [Janthinobacterium sp. K2E3]MBB5608866.1 transporter family-2 protein [Janthinobacterium sp. S3T4]MBB5615938.1 transporter family-2 protein [Janthinobacterium sp. S3M3]